MHRVDDTETGPRQALSKVPPVRFCAKQHCFVSYRWEGGWNLGRGRAHNLKVVRSTKQIWSI